MTDPKITHFETFAQHFDSPRSTSSFQRIQVNHPQQVAREYQDLPRPDQQELLSRLIDHVREL